MHNSLTYDDCRDEIHYGSRSNKRMKFCGLKDEIEPCSEERGSRADLIAGVANWEEAGAVTFTRLEGGGRRRMSLFLAADCGPGAATGETYRMEN